MPLYSLLICQAPLLCRVVGILRVNEASTPILNSTIAARQAGFPDCMDSEDMFRKWARRMHELRLVPPRP